jgi:two-component system chemotaxis response regulator CheY
MPSRVLIVDDNAPIRSMISAMLERGGYEVVAQAADMSEALEAYRSHKPDIVTLDLSLVNRAENGLAVLKALRRMDDKAKVLIIAASAQGKVLDSLREAGASGHLAKPFNYTELIAAMGGLSPAGAPKAARTRPARVLVVDDNPVIRVIIKGMLADHGYDVVAEAEDMGGALEAYKAHKPDVVTLDFSLVKDNGLALLKNLRQMDSQANVLIVSGTAQGKMVDMLRAAGAAGYIPKPFTSAELIAAITAICPS